MPGLLFVLNVHFPGGCPDHLSWLFFFFTPSSHTLDKGRLGLIFSSDSSSFLFLKNKDKSSQEEMGRAVSNCPSQDGGRVDHRGELWVE